MSTKKINYQHLTREIIQQKYPYILLGAAIIVIIFLVIAGFIKKSNITQIIKPLNITKQEATKPLVINKNPTNIYVVKVGDDLWNIAENFYGSGFNAYDIAKHNNINNPNIIEIGQNIIIPSLIPNTPTVGNISSIATTQVKFQDKTYMVIEGDCLWNIAQNAYGDGFAWVRIANANNIIDPNIIATGSVLNIPRD